MMQPLIGTLLLVGAGRMGAAMLRRFTKNPALQKALLVVEPGAEKREHLAHSYGIKPVEQLHAEAFATLPKPVVLLLAVKPQQLPEVLPEYMAQRSHIDAVISIAAGKDIAFYEAAFGAEMPVFRVMPNLPVVVGKGLSFIAKNRAAQRETVKDIAEYVFGLLGAVEEVAERQMNAATAIAGSGPAYLYAVVEAWKKAAMQLGFQEDVAARMVRATVAGAVALQQNENLPEMELMRQVASPGGTTEAALKHFAENQALESLFSGAVQAAVLRAEELSKG